MSDKVYLGSSLVDMSAGDPLLPVSKVILNVDSKTRYEAGDDSGTTIEQDCSWATQEMAESILAKLRGFEYRPFEGDGAFLLPTAELGDGITVGGIYTVLASMGRTFDTHLTATIGAPGSTELEDEYPYETKERKQQSRELARTYSLISKSSEEILQKVANDMEGLSSSLTVALDAITAEVNGKINGEDANTLIKAAIGEITLSVTSANGSTTLTLSDTETTLSTQTLNLTVDAANINGELSADKIKVKEYLYFDGSPNPVEVETLLQDWALSNANPDYIKGTYIDEVSIQSPTIIGGTFIGNEFNVLSESSGGAFNLYGKYWNSNLHVLAIEYSAGDYPAVVFGSPCSASVHWEFGTTYVGGDFDMGGNDILFNAGGYLESLRGLAARVSALESK